MNEVLIVYGMDNGIKNSYHNIMPDMMYNREDYMYIVNKIKILVNRYIKENKKVIFIIEKHNEEIDKLINETFNVPYKSISDNSILDNFIEYKDNIEIYNDISDIRDLNSFETISLVGVFLDILICKNAMYLRSIYNDKNIQVYYNASLTVTKDTYNPVASILDRNTIQCIND